MLLALYGGFIGANKSRHPQFAYAWTVLTISVPIIMLEDFKETSPWYAAGWRWVGPHGGCAGGGRGVREGLGQEQS